MLKQQEAPPPTGSNQPVPNPSGTVSLPGLLDLLAALADEVAELPAPLGLFAAELESGLTEVLTGAGHGN